MQRHLRSIRSANVTENRSPFRAGPGRGYECSVMFWVARVNEDVVATRPATAWFGTLPTTVSFTATAAGDARVPTSWPVGGSAGIVTPRISRCSTRACKVSHVRCPNVTRRTVYNYSTCKLDYSNKIMTTLAPLLNSVPCHRWYTPPHP